MTVLLNFDKALFIKAIKETIPSKYLDANLKAFECGIEYINKER